MHPGFLGWLRRQHADYHAAGHGAAAESSWGRHAWHGHRGCGPGRSEGAWQSGAHGVDEGGSGFGVRRPLRFLAHKLELNDEQVAQLAAILNTLKTERAQSEVDYRRRTAALAEAFEGASFDQAKVDAANADQALSAEHLRLSVKAALEQMHALLNDEQRKKFAYLLRAGVLSI
jgi:Spy/CpxP family protein refolding chaperone